MNDTRVNGWQDRTRAPGIFFGLEMPTYRFTVTVTLTAAVEGVS